MNLFDGLGRENGHQDSPPPACAEPGRKVMKPRSNARKKPSSSSQGRDNIRVFRHAGHRDLADCRRTSAPAERVVRTFRFRYAHAAAPPRRSGDRAPPACARCARTAPAARRRRRLAPGANRYGLEGRVRHGHVAGRGGKRLEAGAGRRPAIANLHPDAAPAWLPVRGAGVDGWRCRNHRWSPTRCVGCRARRLPLNWRAARPVERGRHLRAHRRRGCVASDANRPGRPGTGREIRRDAGCGDGL